MFATTTKPLLTRFMALLLLFLRLTRLQAKQPATANLVEEFAKRYGLTPREAEVMEKNLKSGYQPKELAAELQISERMFYRHLNSIMEKTQTDTRIDLVLLFYGTGSDLNES